MSYRTRHNKKKVEVGNNPNGRKGTMRCGVCRHRKIKVGFSVVFTNNGQCDYISADSPCDYCREHNLSPCLKKWGPKTEGKIQRPIPTTTAEGATLHQDVLLLGFAYSETFSTGAGQILSQLVRMFASTFGHTIDCLSLRHAILACAAAFIPSHLPFYERLEFHSSCARKALINRILQGSVDEGDLFAAFLQTLLSCLYSDFPKFEVHIKGFMAIMKILSRNLKGQTSKYTSILLPLARDLVLEGSRHVGWSSNVIFEFCIASQESIGPQAFSCRTNYLFEVFGIGIDQYYPFSYAIWRHSTLLRRCFRDTVWRQAQGERETNSRVKAIVLEIRSDLDSREIAETVHSLFLLRSQKVSTIPEARRSLLMLLLALHQFCQLIIILLQSKTTLQGRYSLQGMLVARSLVDLVDIGKLTTDYDHYAPFPQSLSRALAARMLWVAGIVLVKDEYSEGEYIQSEGLTSPCFRRKDDYPAA